ncbi:MAG: TrkA family potassium uptake protein [Candidatus Omnitrophica bacterium]|nr:TrkA family potassium uptake protein [Candidatus Omnitrophota bacterium]
MKQIAVIGLGNFGFTLATALAEKKCEVLAIDLNKERVQDIKDKVAKSIVGDATDRDLLNELGVKDVDVAVVSLGDRIDFSVIVTLYLKEMGVQRIIAKAVSTEHAKILHLVGASEVIFPERDEALRLASSLFSGDVLDLIKLSEDFSILELAAPDKYAGKTIKELKLRTKLGIEVLAIRKPLEGALKMLPGADTKIAPDDVLVVLGENRKLKDIEL